MVTSRDRGVATTVSREVARILLDKGAVQVNTQNPFVYTSGIRSPIYCDLRVLIDPPEVRTQLVDFLAEMISSNCDASAIDVVAGVVTSGVPWAAWVADKLGKRMAYVRPEPKAHGKEQRVEGKVRSGDAVILIEDHISTGGSALRAVGALRVDMEARVQHCFSIFTYEAPKAFDGFENAGVKLFSLCGIDTLLGIARALGRLTLNEEGAVREWLREGELAAQVR